MTREEISKLTHVDINKMTREQRMDLLVGLTIEEAKSFVNPKYSFRQVGGDRLETCDEVDTRVNVYMKNGRITKIRGIG